MQRTAVAMKMSKEDSRDNSPDIATTFETFTLEKRESHARRQITDLELEERVAELI